MIERISGLISLAKIVRTNGTTEKYTRDFALKAVRQNLADVLDEPDFSKTRVGRILLGCIVIDFDIVYGSIYKFTFYDENFYKVELTTIDPIYLS